MKTFREMRQEAWKTATTRWSFRLLLVLSLFILLGGLVFTPLTVYFKENSIQTWGAFNEAQLQFRMSGLEYAVPSSQQFWSMTWASSLQGFLEYLFAGLMVFGLVTVALKAIRREDERWFSSAFGGFKAPLEMLWLNVLMAIRILLWSLLFLIPGIIAAFRYAMAWYVKTDHPDYSAAKCLEVSGKLMKGHKFNLFLYGLSYLGWMFLAIISMGVANVLIGRFPALAAVGSALSLALLLFTLTYIIFGQAVYYSELKRLSGEDGKTTDL